jgi:ABC-type bacteriocin/lantibiotic exporter with double-glycine peptidase domain
MEKIIFILGASGSGKTTLISIIGGQVKPERGSVYLNGINIYTIDDYARRSLIALQAQTARTMSGSLRDSLLLGLPRDKHTYADNDLRLIIQHVGLWHIFKEKEGLNTFIGEGGFTLSGGQRQRLNFANLYLRAKYFNPLLILIDEPTSSLDELSEKTITRMIDELSSQALTLVIAHRIKTLETAHKIIDFSLLNESQYIMLYTAEELARKSHYYKQLITGKAHLE